VNRGSSDNFHPFIADTRPHPGQREVAANIRRQLTHSRLVVGKDARTAGLYQDRYALRTASQWIGPQTEDLLLAARQLGIELNSTTDNPLIDARDGHVHHGGNFQAVAVTSAMEKTRQCLQMIGKLMFAQCSELINPMLNHVLTPNLCFDDPNLSFTFKGVDINMAAYYSELGFLANPVSSHVQSAEMHNQAVNSLALISARYTLDAVEVVSLMTAAYLYTVCQALDLHVLYLEYMVLIELQVDLAFKLCFGEQLPSSSIPDLKTEIREVIRTTLTSNKNKDIAQRARAAAEATMTPITKAIMTSSQEGASGTALSSMPSWIERVTKIIVASVQDTRSTFASAQGPPTLRYLGRGSALVYRFVREELRVPLHKGLVEHPTYPEESRNGVEVGEDQKKTIGSRIAVIYEALRSGRMHALLLGSLL
jgi:phenylalanine ammonia-lyase